MLCEKPISIGKLRKKFSDNEILRLAIIAELDAVNLYEQLAASTDKKYYRYIIECSKRRKKSCR